MIEDLKNEFKQVYTDDIRYALLAFVNTEGGRLWIGVDDNGDPCGLKNLDETLLKVTNMARDTIRPDIMPFMRCSVVEMDGKSVICVDVQSGTSKPYYLGSKGIRPEGVYVRQGASSVSASETAILDMIRNYSGGSFENSCSLEQTLTFKTTEEYFKKKKVAFGAAQKKTLGLLRDEKTFTQLAYILSDQSQYSIKVARFDGSDKIVFRDRDEFHGGLLHQLHDVVAWIDRYNGTHAETVGLERVDTRDYPPEAVRESVLNAVVHRDYGMSASTLISIFDDRIEIVSIGGLIKGISYNDIMLGVSMLRNPQLANILYRLKLIEAYGTGILKMMSAYASCAVKPEIKVSDHAFKLILPNINYHRNLERKDIVCAIKQSQNERVKKVLSLFDTKTKITRKDVEVLLGISQPTAVTLLKNMVMECLINVEGNGKNTHYIKV